MRGFQGLDVGDRVTVKLVSTDVERGFIDFRLREIAHDHESPSAPRHLAYENRTSSTATTRGRCASSPNTWSRCSRFQQAGIHDTIVFFGSARLTPTGRSAATTRRRASWRA